jgi:hypothetical protein
MNRYSDPLFDPRVAAWLDEDPSRAPEQVLVTVRAATRSVPQRRATLRVPWRYSFMPGSMRALAGIAAVVVLAAGGLILNASRGPAASTGPALSPSPSAAAVAPTPTLGPLDGTWQAFIDHPQAVPLGENNDAGTWKMIFGVQSRGTSPYLGVLITPPDVVSGDFWPSYRVRFLPGDDVELALDPQCFGQSTATAGTYHYVLTPTTLTFTLASGGDSCATRVSILTGQPWQR